MIYLSSYHFYLNGIFAALVSFLTCLILIRLSSKITLLTGRAEDLLAVQAAHLRVTPRTGGVSIITALIFCSMVMPAQLVEVYRSIIYSASIVFFVGLAEDVGFHMSPRRRFSAAVASSLIAIWLLGLWIPRAGADFADPFLSYWAVGIPVTLLVSAGLSNAFNLIDGMNGLASFAALVAALALSQIAASAGDDALSSLSVFLAASIIGFFLVNFPAGLIFLGDAGAYTLGFLISWVGILILVTAPSVSPWAILLTAFWPFADTLLAVLRRLIKGVDVSSPDRLHLHQLVLRALEMCWLGRNSRYIANPLTTLILSPFIVVPPITGALLWNNNLYAFLATIGYLLLFGAVYKLLPIFIRKFRKRLTPVVSDTVEE